MPETTADLAAYAAQLPEPAELRRRLERLALLDAVLGDGQYPRYTFDAAWSDGVAVGTFDDGAGDDYHAVFAGEHVLVRVFDHESTMSRYDEGKTWPGLLDGLPGELEAYLLDERLNPEPGFAVVTLALWRGPGDTAWRHGRLEPHDGRAPEITSWPLDLVEEWVLDDVYASLSHDHGGVRIDDDAFDAVVEDRPLTAQMVRDLNPEADLERARAAALRIGRPLAG
ncbi:hypothetical protein RDV89_01945 [Nocardioides zeae]|uniref:Immunity protein 35 domain-containing protein n=1 Tax=Nocardioides imazamoxiresistens TaxID=3231893 RepID=A0ABU3PRG1_9ACTN|nr:hypothetical protein [Nocardioides zeae]MDT9591813.1 hypothetical protein [Nocardioides zeae]